MSLSNADLTAKFNSQYQFRTPDIGVRGMSERDIESLGMMGRGLDAVRKFYRRRRTHRRAPPPENLKIQLLFF